MKRLRYENGPMDLIDAKILKKLVEDARISMAELARQVNLSPPSVTERVRRLEEAGVITTYTAVMNPAAIGLPVSVFIRVRPVPGKLKEAIEIISGLKEVVRCDRVTGEDCIVARAHVETIADVEVLVDKLTPVAMISTSVIQSTPVPYRLPEFPIGD